MHQVPDMKFKQELIQSLKLSGELQQIVEGKHNSIPLQRKELLQPLIDYLREKWEHRQEVKLIFICTHNSRRSQFAQVWAQTAAACFGWPVHCYSGGVEVTGLNPNAVASLKRTGFQLSRKGEVNPKYEIAFSENAAPLTCFSKLYDHPANPQQHFAAVMTCSHADQNCPFIPGAEKRMALKYEDPKQFDGLPQEAEKYDECSRQIATELFYAFAEANRK